MEKRSVRWDCSQALLYACRTLVGRIARLRTMPGFVSATSSSMNRRFTIRPITSLGVKCSPAVSFESGGAFLSPAGTSIIRLPAAERRDALTAVCAEAWRVRHAVEELLRADVRATVGGLDGDRSWLHSPQALHEYRPPPSTCSGK